MSKFLTSALGKSDRARPELSVIHGNLATDKFRVHRDNSLPSVDDEVTQRILACGLIPSQPRNRATVSRVDLIAACRRALAFRDEQDRKNRWYPTLTFCMNGSLTYSAKNEGVGSTSGEIVDGTRVTDKVTPIKNGLKYHTHTMVFKHHNPEQVVSFGINPRFLLDALEGMEGETVEIDIPAPRAPFYMTDGTREAVIMPLNVGV
jgi:DNA polymerase III sliding clamp (beta) subunit (PCNA family)